MLICPICGYPLDSDGRCWNCGYWMRTHPGYPLDSDGRCWNCGYWMRTHPLDPFAPGSVYNGGSSDD